MVKDSPAWPNLFNVKYKFGMSQKPLVVFNNNFTDKNIKSLDTKNTM